MTTLTSAQYTRSKIRDIPTWIDVTRYGDGTATRFGLAPHINVTAGSAFVPLGATAWSATGCAYNYSGFVDFSGVISANSAVRLTYQHTVFSDDEINDFLSIGGSILGAAIEAVQALMFDAVKAAVWAAPDGTSYSNVGAQNHTRQLYEKLQEEQDRQSIIAGSQQSWAENQGDY